MKLVFYSQQRERFPDTFLIFCTDDQAVFIARAVADHFGFVLPPIIFWNRSYGEASDSAFNIPHDPNLGGLIHELAHVKDFNDLIERDRREGRDFQHPRKMHCKRLMAIIEEIYDFCKQNDFFLKDL
jgi:hypothetical protein